MQRTCSPQKIGKDSERGREPFVLLYQTLIYGERTASGILAGVKLAASEGRTNQTVAVKVHVQNHAIRGPHRVSVIAEKDYRMVDGP